MCEYAFRDQMRSVHRLELNMSTKLCAKAARPRPEGRILEEKKEKSTNLSCAWMAHYIMTRKLTTHPNPPPFPSNDLPQHLPPPPPRAAPPAPDPRQRRNEPEPLTDICARSAAGKSPAMHVSEAMSTPRAASTRDLPS